MRLSFMNKGILYISLLSFIVTSCGLLDTSNSAPDTDSADTDGNLVLINSSGSRLLVFDGEDRIKVVPNSSEDFLINIPNESGATKDLKLYLYDSVDDYDSPSSENLYRRWNVVLSADTDLENRATWFVTDDRNVESNSGEITFSYVGGTDYSVDVMLNSKTGAKLLSLSPGQNDSRLGIDYGNYTVLYRYWSSDQNTAEGSTEIGWIDNELVNNQEVL